MPRSKGQHGRLTEKRFWDRLSAVERLAESAGAKFEGDTPEARLARKARAVLGRDFFARTYLPHYFRDGGCGLHRLITLAVDFGRFVAIRAPRGHGKSTSGTFLTIVHKAACGEVLRAWEQGTLEQEDPTLYAALQAAMAAQVERLVAEGPLTCERLALPAHWDPEVDRAMDAWLSQVHQRLVGERTYPLTWDPYIQVLAVDGTTAEEFTAAARVELERNPLLRYDWGDLTPCMAGDWTRPHRRQASDADWESNGVRVRAFGMGESLRGGKHGAWRPTLALGDDLDSEASVQTLKQRDANAKKIDSALIGGLDEKKRRVIVVGTPVDADCIVCRESELDRYKKRWTALRVRARDETGRVLYPAKWSNEALQEEQDVNDDSYGSELDDRPPQDASRPFRELHYYRRADYAGVKLPKAMAFDPSLGRSTAKRLADFQALVQVRGPTKEGYLLVDLAELLRIPDPELLIGTVNGIYDREQPDIAAVEAISVGSLLESLLTSFGARAGIFPSWVRIERQEASKDIRIRGLAPLISKGIVRFPDDGSCRPLERQLLAYPHGKKDGPDVLEMAVRMLRQVGRASLVDSIRHTARRAARAFAQGAWRELLAAPVLVLRRAA